jgi:hypothetical protein
MPFQRTSAVTIASASRRWPVATITASGSEGMPVAFGPDGPAGDLMEGVVAVQGAEHDRRVEQR